ncbi:hypothetical protein OS493_015431 [Desmophyllum pertusum]|uniref:Cytochrome c oxidase assembly protein n=1 Tax=Desmophyllum pertusum TaxID=174260 RepID=A0A9W9Z0Z7_9CNID|nr:hypothetical protein OS493_015431 [Desmophyllum pertusum]
MISRGAKVALGGAFCFASAVIFMVHQMQNIDRKRLREGVIRDLERQEKKRRNIEELEQQIELTKKLQEQRDWCQEMWTGLLNNGDWNSE